MLPTTLVLPDDMPFCGSECRTPGPGQLNLCFLGPRKHFACRKLAPNVVKTAKRRTTDRLGPSILLQRSRARTHSIRDHAALAVSVVCHR